MSFRRKTKVVAIAATAAALWMALSLSTSRAPTPPTVTSIQPTHPGATAGREPPRPTARTIPLQVEVNPTSSVATPGVRVRLLDGDSETSLPGRAARVTLRSEGRLQTETKTTDDLGAFVLPELLEGHYSLGVQVSDYLPYTRSLTVPAAAASDDEIVLRLRRGASLGGVVVDTRERGIARAQVRLTLLQGSTVYQASTSSDAKGRFELRGLPTGSYRLVATGVDMQPEVLELEIPAISEARVVLEEDPGMTLRILHASGEAVSGARVKLRSRTYGIRSGRRSVVTAEDGLARLSGADLRGPGNVRFEITHDHYPPTHRDVSRASLRAGPVEVELQGGNDITGRVTDEYGEAVRSARVEVHRIDHAGANVRDRKTLRTVASGRFHFKNMPRGNYRIVATVADGRSARREIALAAAAEDVALELPGQEPGSASDHRPSGLRRSTLTGRVATTTPVTGAILRLEPAASLGRSAKTYRFTSERLDFRLNGIYEGVYNLTLVRGDQQLARIDGVTVGADTQTEPVVLTVTPPLHQALTSAEKAR